MPVLIAALVVFAVGSLVTALAYDLPSMVAGRFLQGVGGGGLVPATLALVADLYPAERRGVPLGIVSAVQELGSVLGPLFGAVVLAVADWPAIFAHQPRGRRWSCAAAIRAVASRSPASASHHRRDRAAESALDLGAGRPARVTLVVGRDRLRPAAAAGARPDLGRATSSRSPATAAG